mgnify:CR=1 FL=1
MLDNGHDDDKADDDSTVKSYYERFFQPEYNEMELNVILEKISAFCLSLFLFTTLLSTLMEIKFFLVLNFLTKSEYNAIHVIAFFNQYSALLLTLACTQILFIDAPNIRDLMLNCAALGFVVEVDNCFSALFSHSLRLPYLYSVRLRSDRVLSHIRDNYKNMKERTELRTAYATKKMAPLWNIHKVLAMYENFFMFFFIVVGVLMTGVGAYCIPNNQEMANLSGNKEFMRDLSG